MIKEFRDFIAKGNVMDLAVGLIIGAAFTAIVKSMVSDLINPVIGLFFVVLNAESTRQCNFTRSMMREAAMPKCL